MFYNAIWLEIGKSGDKDNMKLRRLRDDLPSGNSFHSEQAKVTRIRLVNICNQVFCGRLLIEIYLLQILYTFLLVDFVNNHISTFSSVSPIFPRGYKSCWTRPLQSSLVKPSRPLTSLLSLCHFAKHESFLAFHSSQPCPGLCPGTFDTKILHMLNADVQLNIFIKKTVQSGLLDDPILF